MIPTNPDDGYAPVWINGTQETSLYDMDTKHIENALQMFIDDRFGHMTTQYYHRVFWIKVMKEELQSREGESYRHPKTNEFLTQWDIREQRKLKRLILGLSPMLPDRPNMAKVQIDLTPGEDFVSLFDQDK